MRKLPTLSIALPGWLDEVAAEWTPCATDGDKMRLVIGLARENVIQGTGGPFGAAVFRRNDHHLVAVGVNLVEKLDNSALHAEMVALMLAEKLLGSYTLGAPGFPQYELISSCAPCAMCLGAALWSGVKRIVYGAERADALALGFEEGPVFPESYRYLEDRGIDIVPGVLSGEAAAVFHLYREREGLIYNP